MPGGSARHFPAWELSVVASSRTMAPMRLTPLLPDAVPPASQPILDTIADDLGFVPNMAATIAASPTLLMAFDAVRRALAGARLDPVAREIAGLAVGVAVDNRYGVAFHSTVLDRLGVDGAEIARMRAGETPTDPRFAAVHGFARDVALTRGKIEAHELAGLAAAGYDTSEVLEIVAECTFAGLVGVVDNLAGHVPLDAFLERRAWN
jgi:alkylhydroperoxidase family enzyme